MFAVDNLFSIDIDAKNLLHIIEVHLDGSLADIKGIVDALKGGLNRFEELLASIIMIAVRQELIENHVSTDRVFICWHG